MRLSLRGKPEASCHDRRLHLDLAENGDEGSRLQPFFNRPGRIRSVPRLNDEDKRGVETEGDEPRPVRRAPFARGPFGQAPEERRGVSRRVRRSPMKASAKASADGASR